MSEELDVRAKKYLKALSNEITYAITHLELAEKLLSYTLTHTNTVNLSPGFWSFTLTAHLDQGLLHLAKIVDTEDKSFSIYYFLRFAKNNISIFSKEALDKRLSAQGVDKHFKEILLRDSPVVDIPFLGKLEQPVKKFMPEIRNLRIWRNKKLAHIDEEFLSSDKLETLAKDFPLRRKETMEAIKELGEIVHTLYMIFESTDYQFGVVGVNDGLDRIFKDLTAHEKERKEKYGLKS